MRETRDLISIWFFIGVLVLIYGITILGSGLYELVYPPLKPVVLSELHAPIWWGGLLLILGLFYTVRFAPRRKK